MNTKQLKETLRAGRYAWPGGYPTFLFTDDGGVLCHDCARDNFRDIVDAIKSHSRNGWRVEGHDVNWENPWLTCDHCGSYIESAYAERDEEGGEE